MASLLKLLLLKPSARLSLFGVFVNMNIYRHETLLQFYVVSLQ